MKIYWLGPVGSEETVKTDVAFSPAANSWQINFIKALSDNGFSVNLLTYKPAPCWPRGSLWIKSDPFILDSVSVGYLNLPLVRDFWIAFGLFLKVGNLGAIDLFTYNPVFRHRLFVLLAKAICHCKWYSIIADDCSVGNPDVSIFLSYDYFNRSTVVNKYFFYGGVVSLNCSVSVKTTKVLLYAGSFTKWTGIDDFIALFDHASKNIDMELHLYGKSYNVDNKYYEQNSKIKYKGYVSPKELHDACCRAFAFVNPRPLSVQNGDNNFPSKILMYLGYQKPIISTRVKSLSPEFDDFLIYYDPFSSQSLRDCLSSISANNVDVSRDERRHLFINKNSWFLNVKHLIKSMLDNHAVG